MSISEFSVVFFYFITFQYRFFSLRNVGKKKNLLKWDSSFDFFIVSQWEMVFLLWYLNTNLIDFHFELFLINPANNTEDQRNERFTWCGWFENLWRADENDGKIFDINEFVISSAREEKLVLKLNRALEILKRSSVFSVISEELD